MRLCSKCHQEKEDDQFRPNKKTAKCMACLKAQDNAYYEANKQKWVERDRRLREEDPEGFKGKNREAQERYRHRPNSIKLRYLQNRYGITVEQYEEMALKQNGVCAICGCLPYGRWKRLHVDHDHVTGKVRALLCFKHNIMLGFAEDSIDNLKAAILYLEKYKDQGEQK